MTSQQLQCFIYVAERLNFTKAAEALYLSVPTVTHHIQNLEEEIGTQLFYRNSRIVKLTESGEKFYYTAKDIFMKMEDAKKQFQTNSLNETVVFRIGCMTEREFDKMRPILKEMREKFPYVRRRVTVKSFFDLKTLYENQQLDVTIATGDFSNRGTYKNLCNYQSYGLVTPNHKLAGEKILNTDRLTEETLITLPSRAISFIKGNKLQEFLVLHSQVHRHIVSENENESILLAQCGYGVSILPGFLLPKTDDLICIPIEHSRNIKYGLYYKNDEKHIKFFINEYTKHFDDK